MRRLLHPRWLCLVALAVLACLEGWRLGMLVPVEARVAELEKQLAGARTEEAVLSREVHALRADDKRMDDERARMRIFLHDILGAKADGLPDTQALLRELAGKHGMDPEVIPLAFRSDPEKLGVLVELGMTMKVETTYPRLKAFLEEFAATPRLIVLNTLSVESKAAATDSLEITLGMETWFVDAELLKARPPAPEAVPEPKKQAPPEPVAEGAAP